MHYDFLHAIGDNPTGVQESTNSSIKSLVVDVSQYFMHELSYLRVYFRILPQKGQISSAKILGGGGGGEYKS